MRIAKIDLSSKEFEIEENSYQTILEYAIDENLKEETFKLNPYSEDNFIIFGQGPFVGSKLQGVHRLIAISKSPLTKALHISAAGGIAYKFYRTSLDGIKIEGKLSKLGILSIKYDGEIKIKIDEIGKEELYKIYKGYRGLIGIYALSQYLIDKYKDYYNNLPYRALVIGIASFNTDYGCIASIDVVNNKLNFGSEDFFGRGGLGSILASKNVIAIVFGGNFERKEIKEKLSLKKLNEIFKKKFGKEMIKVIFEKTKKYRYDEKINTGGTFGANYESLREFTPLLNWTMPLIKKEKRKELYEKLIKGENWLKAFNERIIKNRSFKTCGEPCIATCKKVFKNYKIDYEPFSSLGPNLGIIDIDMVINLVSLSDALGFDAIEIGNTISWIFELIDKGLIRSEELGIEEPILNEINFYSMKRNSEIAFTLLKKIAYGENRILRIFGKNKLEASQILNELFKERLRNNESFSDYSFFVNTKEGAIAPTMYWALGNFVPVPFLGRFCTFYKYGVFLNANELMEKSFERAVKEIWIDNLGVCRFHRKWFEEVEEELCKQVGIELSKERKIELIKKIYKYQEKCDGIMGFWKSKKVRILIKEGAKEFGNEEINLKEFYNELLDSLQKLIKNASN